MQLPKEQIVIELKEAFPGETPPQCLYTVFYPSETAHLKQFFLVDNGYSELFCTGKF